MQCGPGWQQPSHECSLWLKLENFTMRAIRRRSGTIRGMQHCMANIRSFIMRGISGHCPNEWEGPEIAPHIGSSPDHWGEGKLTILTPLGTPEGMAGVFLTTFTSRVASISAVLLDAAAMAQKKACSLSLARISLALVGHHAVATEFGASFPIETNNPMQRLGSAIERTTIIAAIEEPWVGGDTCLATLGGWCLWWTRNSGSREVAAMACGERAISQDEVAASGHWPQWARITTIIPNKGGSIPLFAFVYSVCPRILSLECRYEPFLATYHPIELFFLHALPSPLSIAASGSPRTSKPWTAWTPTVTCTCAVWTACGPLWLFRTVRPGHSHH